MFITSNLFKCIYLIYSNKWWWHANLQPCFSFYSSDIHLCYLLVIIYNRFLFLVLILSVLLIHLGTVLASFGQVSALALWLQDHSGIWPLLWFSGQESPLLRHISFYCPCWREEFDRYDLNLLQNGNIPGLGIVYFLPNAFLKGMTYRDVV